MFVYAAHSFLYVKAFYKNYSLFMCLVLTHTYIHMRIHALTQDKKEGKGKEMEKEEE